MIKIQEETENIANAVIEGIQRVKGKDILKIDLTTINHSECSYFIICHGTSNTQVSALGHSVEETVEELTGSKVWHSEGYENALWVLLDYGEVIVHLFQKNARDFYNLENLWADAAVIKIEEN